MPARRQPRKVAANQGLYDRLINAFSMRSFVPTAGFSGHDQFFSTFERYGGIDRRHIGEWVDEVASRAAQQNQQYVELMETPVFTHAAYIASKNPLTDTRRFCRNIARRCWRSGCATKSLWTAKMCVPPRRCVANRAVRHDSGRVCLPGPDPVHLPGAARHSPEQVFAQALLAFETIWQPWP